jgi:hypothetical protein
MKGILLSLLIACLLVITPAKEERVIMKKLHIVLLALIFLLTGLSNANGQRVKFSTVQPPMPTINDSIVVIDSVFTSASGFVLMQNRVSKVNNNITLFNCYNDSAGFTINSYIKDTIPIGKLSTGTYHCTVYSRYSYRATIHDPIIPCDSLPFIDSFKFSFTVSEFHTGLDEIDVSKIYLYPNPVFNKIHFSATLPERMNLEIFDISGRIICLPLKENEIDVTNLSAGLYFIRLQQNGENIVRRFIKE